MCRGLYVLLRPQRNFFQYLFTMLAMLPFFLAYLFFYLQDGFVMLVLFRSNLHCALHCTSTICLTAVSPCNGSCKNWLGLTPFFIKKCETEMANLETSLGLQVSGLICASIFPHFSSNIANIFGVIPHGRF